MHIAKQRLIIAGVCFGSFICILDAYILGISLPAISAYFNASPSKVSWVVILYFMIFSSTLLVFGKMGDRFGFRNLFILGYLLFGFGSLMCGSAWNIGILIAGRCIQGFGGSIIYALGPAILNTFLPANVRGRAFGIRSSVSGLGVGLGAPLGGLIVTYLSWHWIFFINIPVCILAALMVKKLIPNEIVHKARSSGARLDIKGFVLSFVCIISLMYSLNMGQENGWNSSIILSGFTVFFITLILFIYFERKSKDPMLDIILFRNLDFSFANLAIFFAYMLLAAVNFLLPFYFIEAKGLSAVKSSMIILVYSVILITVSPYMGRISDRINSRYLCSAGIFVMTCACVLFAFTLSLPGFWAGIIFFILMGIAYSIFLPANNHLIMQLAPHDKQGVVSGAFKMIVNVGMALGVCIFEAMFSFSLPPSVSTNGISVAVAKVSPKILFASFQNVFILGIIVSCAALAASVLGYLIHLKQQTTTKI